MTTTFEEAGCPKCGASWDSLQKDLETEPICSRALDQALTIIFNCDLCQLKFKPQIETCRRVYTARRLNKGG